MNTAHSLVFFLSLVFRALVFCFALFVDLPELIKPNGIRFAVIATSAFAQSMELESTWGKLNTDADFDRTSWLRLPSTPGHSKLTNHYCIAVFRRATG